MSIYKNSPSIVTNGLVLYLDAGNPNSYTSGSATWYDLSGQGNHAVFSGSVPYSNNGFVFTANSSNYIYSINNFTSSISSSGALGYTIIAAVNCADLSSRNVVFSHDTSSATAIPGYFLEVGTIPSTVLVSSSRAYAGSSTGNGGDIRGTFALSNNTNYLLAATFTTVSTSQSLYLNGLNTNTPLTTTYSVTTTNNWSNTNRPYTIGGDILYGQVVPWAFAGSIYSIMVYNRALSDAEIQQNYQAQKSRFNLT